MLTTTIIITICCLLLLAYVFDITSPHTRVPSVILLLLLGWLVKQLSLYFEIYIPDLQPLLPVLGSVGLILIVLEGSLELELNSSKKKIIIQSVVSSFIPILLIAGILTFLLNYFGGYPIRKCLINILPLCVISSSVAISSGRNLSPLNREFITYESSLSDIFGVLIFNFFLLNDSFGWEVLTTFSLQLVFILIVSIGATIGLAFLLNKINHHVKFAPIILLIILIYEVSKEYHLPALIFILLFGLVLGNLDEIKGIKWLDRLKKTELDKEVHKFKEITAEATFLIRALFFLLFGYLIQTADILNFSTFIWAVIIVAVIFIVRVLVLRITKVPLFPLSFIAPRGLITILLFFAIDPSMHIGIVNSSLILQVILLSAMIMMFGMMAVKKGKGVLIERHEVLVEEKFEGGRT